MTLKTCILLARTVTAGACLWWIGQAVMTSAARRRREIATRRYIETHGQHNIMPRRWPM